MPKKILSLLLTALIISSFAITGCGNKQVSNGKPIEVTFWYMWTGHDAETYEKIVSEFNKKQSKYVVKGLSVPDEKKIIAAIASGSGPDVTDSYSEKLASYASKGIIQPLDSYVKKDNFTKDFAQSALSTCKYNGKLYALPIGGGAGMKMYYNKKLLKDAGFNEPPKTDKEMMEVAYKTTKVEKDGTISVLGFPDFPFVYYPINMTFALGGNLISKDGKELTPDNEATIKALNMIWEYRNKYGKDKIDKFNSANGAYVSPQDPFITGHQALRIDGMWLVTDIAKYNKDLDYGVTILPYPDGHPELAGGGESSTSVFYIPSCSKQKQGAWEFLKYIEGEQGMKEGAIGNGGIPARKSLWKDPEIAKQPGFDLSCKQIASNNLKMFPSFPSQDQYNTELTNAFDLATNGKMTPEAAMKQCKEKVKDLLKTK